MQDEATRAHTPEEIERALRESEERYRAFIANSSEGIWRFELEPPVPTDLSEDEQLELFYRVCYLAECNDAAARMYGFERAEQIVGGRLGQFLVREDPANVEYLRAFIRSGYRLTDAESVEIDRDGHHRYFLNNLVGAVENGRLVRAWGTQRDATAMKEAEEKLRRGDERYRSLLENANDIVYSHDLAGNYLAINRAGAEITGYTREELLGGLNISQVVAPEHLELARRMTAEKLRDPTRPTVYEVDIISRDGRRLTLEVSTRIAYRDGQPFAVEGIARDVTERVRAAQERERLLAEARGARDEAQEALERRRDVEARLRTLVDASASLLGSPQTEVVLPAVLALSHRLIAADAYAIWRLSPVDAVWSVVASSGLSESYRHERIEVTPHTVQILDGPLIVEDVLKAPKLEYRQARYRREGIRALLTLPLWARGEIMGTLVFYYREPRRFAETDVAVATALANLAASAVRTAELYDEQLRLRGEAQEANRIKDEFLATLSHELRTPLTAILGWASMLASGTLDEQETPRAVAAIERNARAQRQIVEDVLDVSRIITGKLRLEMRPVELRALVQDAVESVRPAAEAKGLYLSTLLAPDAGEVMGDPDRLQQVLWNLLSNAVKFTPTGGRVEVELRREGLHTALRVSDTGEGIAPEFLPYVFDRFRQADMGTTRLHGGLGIGLAIVRHLVELHGGEVSAQSAGRGLGSTLLLRLPLRPSRPGPDSPKPLATKPAAVTNAKGAARLAGTRVLLVEDEADARLMLKALLEGYGASVDAVGSAAEAWEMLEGAGCDVLLSDIGMPDEDGYSFIGRLRGHGAMRVKETPAVALTAYAREDDRERSLAAGFDAYLPKPVEPSELLEVLAGLTKRSA